MKKLAFRVIVALVTLAATPLTLPAHEGFTRTEQRLNYGQTLRNTGVLTESFEALPAPPEMREKLTEAVRLTGRRQFDEAAAVYREMSAAWPEHGLAAEARFLVLRRNEEAIADLRERLATAEISLLARSRALSALGDNEAALAVLLTSDDVTGGVDVAGALLAARLLGNNERAADRQTFLANAIIAAPQPLARRLLLENLIATAPKHLLSDPSLMARVLEAGLGAAPLESIQGNELLFRLVLDFVDAPDYFNRRDALLQLAPETGPVAVWFGSRLIAREERFADALKWVSEHEARFRGDASYALLQQEKVGLMRNLGQAEAAEAVLDTMARTAELGGGTASDSLYWELAGLALARRDSEKALTLMRKIDPEGLHEANRNSYWYNYLREIGGNGDIARLIEVYPKAFRHLKNDDHEFAHRMIFALLDETDQHHALEAAVREKFSTDPTTPPILWLLAAAAAEESRRMPNRIEALFQWVQADPHNNYALGLLAADVVPLVTEMLGVPVEAIVAPEGEVARMRSVAEQVLQRLIESQPYMPEHYIALINLMKAEGRGEEARDYLIARAKSSTNLMHVGIVGFVLATNGYPEQGISLYDLIIESEPANMHIRANRAAAYTRVGRMDEAAAFYKKALEEGYNGLPYHVHDNILRLWDIASSEGMEDEMIAYFNEAVRGRINPAWRTYAATDIATLMAREGELEAATAFFTHLREDPSIDSATRAQAWQAQALMRHNAGDIDGTIAMLLEGEKNLEGAPDQAVDFRNLRAELIAQKGETEVAARLIVETAQLYPNDLFAQEGYFRAAELFALADNNKEAERYFKEFLLTESRDFPRRQAAEQWLAKQGTASP